MSESEKVGRELTKEFYVRYANIRQDAFEQLATDNPGVSRHDVLTCTQKLLDRVLFCAFCEDRGLLPSDSLKKAYEHRDPYHPRPIWQNFHSLFSAINFGNQALDIYAFNGGLFAKDPILDHMNVSDQVCGYFRDLGDYDYQKPYQATVSDSRGSLIDVEILGHIFEQSITDLEKLRNELDGLVEPVGVEKHKTRRKKEGAFYTPEFITRYILEQALGGVVKDRFEQHRKKHEEAAKGTAKKALEDPNVYIAEELNNPQSDALINFWESWQDELKTIRILDPACGSGAFLVGAFDQLLAIYMKSNERLEELRGHRSLFDLGRQILENNLFGVDLNEEAIEICRLSLWIKTAEKGKPLTSLDRSIRVGNSVVSDTAIHPKALDWNTAFPDVFVNGGFDVVVGNPPYIRQEWLSQFKPHFESRFPEVYSGTADIYVYFYGLGLQLLKSGGRLAFISSNSFVRAAYAERLRDHLVQHANLREFIDFGDTQVFSDAKDVYPAIVLIEKPDITATSKTPTVRTIRLRREDNAADIAELTRDSGGDVPISRLRSDGWQFEKPELVALRERLRTGKATLGTYVGNRFYRGLITGLNEAFVVSKEKKISLVSTDPNSSKIIKPFVGGRMSADGIAKIQEHLRLFYRAGLLHNGREPRTNRARGPGFRRLFPPSRPISNHLRCKVEKGQTKANFGGSYDRVITTQLLTTRR